MQTITPFLWFDDRAEEAAKFYTSVFKNSKVGKIVRYGEEAAKVSQSGRPLGSVLTIEFELEGQKFTALNGGPQFKFTEAISLMHLRYETQHQLRSVLNCGHAEDKTMKRRRLLVGSNCG